MDEIDNFDETETFDVDEFTGEEENDIPDMEDIDLLESYGTNTDDEPFANVID